MKNNKKVKKKKNMIFPIVLIIFLSIVILIIILNMGAAKECENVAGEIYKDKDISCNFFNDNSEEPCKCKIFSCRENICDLYKEIEFKIKDDTQ